MAPIRRYLRITKYSVLEVRIYLDNPALAQTWLLSSRDPVLPRVIESVRPWVLPKLREENERVKGKGKGKKKGVKDVVVTDEFEVSIFLTELSTRHSLLTKSKDFGQKSSRIKSNTGKLTGWLTTGHAEKPIEVADNDVSPTIAREEEDAINLDDIPEVDAADESGESTSGRRSRKRPRYDAEDALFVEEEIDSDDALESVPDRGTKRQRNGKAPVTEEQESGKDDDKKKLGFNTSYEGFSIYGRILCLVVKRRGGKSKATAGTSDAGQQMLENWVSTQATQQQMIEDDEEG
ncbi:MAG: hypothetical protein M1820_003659 [Bogoriella megaspora]|nr:MAG: hypothetical protein M1820_003659 [Bogoriella megaspora]